MEYKMPKLTSRLTKHQILVQNRFLVDTIRELSEFIENNCLDVLDTMGYSGDATDLLASVRAEMEYVAVESEGKI